MVCGLKRWMVGVAALLPLALGAGSSYAATAEQVETALKRAVDYLYSIQDDKGTWEEVPARDPKGVAQDVRNGQWGGMTALATYSLLAAGEKPTDPRLQKAIAFLEKADEMQGIYALGLRAQVWSFLPLSDEVRRAIRRDVDLFARSCDATGRFGYMAKFRNNDDLVVPHNSTSQYGVLGMWACEEASAGVEISNNFWLKVEKGWQACQGRDGGWHYMPTVPNSNLPAKLPDGDNAQWEGATGTMTAAGIATLFITQDYLRANDGIECKGNITNANIEAGLAWMAKNYTPEWKDGYFLYGLERIGVASGIKYFGKYDWYQTGSDALVNSQTGQGSWLGLRGSSAVNTSFGILFLVRGRAPVVINKLQYDITREKAKPVVGPWNQRPRDVANITRYLGKKTERDVNWQIVNLESTPEALLEAPILYIAGNKPLAFTSQELTVLRQYVERGGLILGHADGGSQAFAASFRSLIKELFPNATARDLPAEHVIYTNQSYLRSAWRTKPRLEGWSNGVRELALLFPYDDQARQWQMRMHQADKASYSEIMANIYLYAVDKQKGRVKGESYLAQADASIQDEATLKLARLEYNGNWNPEPGGWVQLQNNLHNTQKLGLTVETVTLGQGKLASGGYKVAHLTGTGELKLGAAESAELKDFVDKGGILVIDAAGGSTEFANSAATLLSQLNQSVPPILPTSDMVISGNGVGPDCTNVRYRRFAMATMRKTPNPRLRAQFVQDRKAIFFSEEDLSSGLVGNSIDGIKGYEPVWATNLMTNILLYAAGKIPESPPPTTTP